MARFRSRQPLCRTSPWLHGKARVQVGGYANGNRSGKCIYTSLFFILCFASFNWFACFPSASLFIILIARARGDGTPSGIRKLAGTWVMLPRSHWRLRSWRHTYSILIRKKKEKVQANLHELSFTEREEKNAKTQKRHWHIKLTYQF